jgi:hypothetical protein
LTDPSMARLGWDELPSGTHWLFNVWSEGADLRWAQTAWSILDEAGLTRFDDETGRHTVLGRLLALAAYYHSFCQAAWEEGAAVPDQWASDLELDGFRVARLLGWDLTDEDELDSSELLGECARELIEQEYPAVEQALAAAFENESLLFVFLWLSRDPELSGRRSHDWETLDVVLNGDVFAKMPGFEWLTGGAPIHFA